MTGHRALVIERALHHEDVVLHLDHNPAARPFDATVSTTG